MRKVKLKCIDNKEATTALEVGKIYTLHESSEFKAGSDHMIRVTAFPFYSFRASRFIDVSIEPVTLSDSEEPNVFDLLGQIEGLDKQKAKKFVYLVLFSEKDLLVAARECRLSFIQLAELIQCFDNYTGYEKQD